MNKKNRINKKAQVSPDFSASRLPEQAARLTIPPTPGNAGEAIAAFNKPLKEFIIGGRRGAGKKNSPERAVDPGLDDMLARHMPWAVSADGGDPDFADKLQLPAFYYLEHHMVKVGRDSETGDHHLYVILSRSKDPNCPPFNPGMGQTVADGERITILDLTQARLRNLCSSDQIFVNAITMHVNHENARMEVLNKYIEAHDRLSESLERNPVAGGLTRWCPMVLASIGIVNDRLAKLGAMKQAYENRGNTGLSERVLAEGRARQGSDLAFRAALSNNSMFKAMEDVIVHIFSQYSGEEGKIAEAVQSGNLDFSDMERNLSQSMNPQNARDMINGLKGFLVEASLAFDKFEQESLRKVKQRRQDIEAPKPGVGTLPQAPSKIGPLEPGDMPKWVFNRMQSYRKMDNWASQGIAANLDIGAVDKALRVLLGNLNSIHQTICPTRQFPKKLELIRQNPAAKQALIDSGQAIRDYFQKYSSEMFIEDPEGSGNFRIDKRRIGGGSGADAIGELRLGIYLLRVVEQLDKILERV